MPLQDLGELQIDCIDEMNVPINSFISEEKDSDSLWEWTADNFMPRKARCSNYAWSIKAETKEELIAFVNEKVVPVYEAALNNLKVLGENYYWEDKTKENCND